jgi:hypothetical protein
MIRSYRGALVGLMMASLGCNVFDPKLYMQHAGSGTDLAMTGNDGGAAGSDMSDSGQTPPTICGSPDPATLCPGGTVFCDGFEDENGSNFPHWSGTILDNYGGGNANPATLVTIDGNTSCLGSRALHAHTVGAQQQAFVYRTFGNRPNPLYVRFFFYVTQLPNKPFEMLGFFENGGDFDTLFFDPAAHQFAFSNNFSTANSSGTMTLPLHRWMCLELTTKLDPTNGEVALTIDGKSIAGAKGISTERMGHQFANVNVGLIATDAAETGNADIFFDEVAISSSPIGCQ